MPEVPISTVDELHQAFIKLETVTYLEMLLYADEDENYVFSDNMHLGKENAAGFLLEQQRESLDTLRRLLFRELF